MAHAKSYVDQIIQHAPGLRKIGRAIFQHQTDNGIVHHRQHMGGLAIAQGCSGGSVACPTASAPVPLVTDAASPVYLPLIVR
jgi:hypothetical protein